MLIGAALLYFSLRSDAERSDPGAAPPVARDTPAPQPPPEPDTVVREDSRAGLPRYPPDFPRIEFERLRPGPEGLFVVSTVRSRNAPPWVMVFDEDGHALWWFRPSTLAFDAQILPNGRVAWSRGFGDGYGIDPRSAAEVHSLDGGLRRLIRTPGSITDVHEFEPAPDGHVFLDSYVPQGRIDLSRWDGPRRANVVLPRIIELDREGKVVWEWQSRGHIRLVESHRWWNDNVLQNPKQVKGRETFDAVHLNSVDPWGEDRVVISARHTDAVYGLEKSSGEVLWKLGGTPTRDSLRIVGDPYGQIPFGGQHDARMTSDILSVYDNETKRGRPPRAVFYRIDAEAGTATYISALRDPIIKSSHCCGSVRAFGDGWLVNWGDNRWITGFDRAGRVSFRLHLPSSAYRAIPVPPGAVSEAELAAGMAAAPEERVPLLTP